jgi:hypothetical protein
MAVTTLDAYAARMVLMAELHRLLDEPVGVRHEVRPLDRQHDQPEAEQHKDDGKDAGFRPGVSTFWEYLRHAIQQPLGLFSRAARKIGTSKRKNSSLYLGFEGTRVL